jgi:predicted ATPase
MTKGNVADNILFSIADQIKHGIGNLAEEKPELRIDIAILYELAGTKAVACSDHAASRSYLTYALSLLPNDHWKSHYDLSLQFSLQLAKSCYSCGDLERAQCILQEMTGHCHSIQDTVPANALLATSMYSVRCR